MGEHKVHGHELAEDRVPFRRPTVAVVLFADRRIERAGIEVKDVALSPVRQDTDMVSSHTLGQEADRRLAVRAPGEGHLLATQEVPAVQRDEHEELRLAGGVAEHLKCVAAIGVGRHRSSVPM